MREVILFIASSLDGFIARSDGSVDWLFMDEDYGYSVHPIILGDGIPLFPQGIDSVQLDFVKAESFGSGLVQLTYHR